MTFDIWWKTNSQSLDLEEFSSAEREHVRSVAHQAWAACFDSQQTEIKQLKDNIDLLEQTLEDEMNEPSSFVGIF